MSDRNQDPVDFTKTVQLIHTAIAAGLLSFGLVVLFMMFTGSQSSPDGGNTTAQGNMPFAVVGGVAPILATVFALIVRIIMGRSRASELIPRSTYLMWRHMFFLVILEAGGLFGVTMSLVSGSPAGLICAGVPLVFMIIMWPTRARFDPDYDARNETADWVKDG